MSGGLSVGRQDFLRELVSGTTPSPYPTMWLRKGLAWREGVGFSQELAYLVFYGFALWIL